jgi:hypothetical protein
MCVCVCVCVPPPASRLDQMVKKIPVASATMVSKVIGMVHVMLYASPTGGRRFACFAVAGPSGVMTTLPARE